MVWEVLPESFSDTRMDEKVSREMPRAPVAFSRLQCHVKDIGNGFGLAVKASTRKHLGNVRKDAIEGKLVRVGRASLGGCKCDGLGLVGPALGVIVPAVPEVLRMTERGEESSAQQQFRAESALVLPGDRVVDTTADLPETLRPLRVGPGVVALPDWEQPQQLVSSQAGRLRYAPRLYVEVDQRRYIPYVNDVVVGIVLDRVGSEHYRVAIGSATPALLPVLAFEGATKRNRPHLVTGHVIYARVTQVPTPQRYVETELSCQSPGGGKNWTSGESIFGQLRGGTLFRVSLASARQLIRRECAILEQLGRVLHFEVAIGMNGTVWIKGSSPRTTILVQRAIEQGLYFTPAESRRFLCRMLGAE